MLKERELYPCRYRTCHKTQEIRRKAYQIVHPNGSKYWRLRYSFEGKERLLALGVYPDVSLAEARERRDKARKHIANGVDPGVLKKASKRQAKRL